MYRRFLQAISTSCLLFTFWPVVRLNNISTFDCLAPLVILAALPYTPKERGASFGAFTLAVLGIALLALAGIISVATSYDSYEHILKVVNLVGALSAIVGLGFVLVNRRILTIVQALSVLCVSAAASSAVCILQGKFGIFTSIIPDAPEGIQAWVRMTGLAEHPIETGDISALGVVIGLGLGIYTRKWIVYLIPIAINIYSIQFSASLTALFGLFFASGILCLYAKAYKTLLCGAIVSICGLALAFTLSDAHLLTSRLSVLSQNQGNYETVRTREMQWSKSLDMIEPKTLLIGNGYSTQDLPYNLDIHNALIASVFHFGLLGLVSQVLLISFFAMRLRHDGPRTLRGILLGCMIIFVFSYLTGPVLSRRTLWVPVLILGAYLTTQKESAPARSRQVVGGLNLRSKRELRSDT